MDKLMQDFEELRAHFHNSVHVNGLVNAPASASTQATGGAGITVWRVWVNEMLVAVDAVSKYFAESQNLSIHSGSNLLQVGQGCVAAVVIKNVSGTLSVVTVKGVVASSPVSPTDSAIDSAVGASNEWIKAGETTLTRTSDVVVNQTYNRSARPLLSVNFETSFGDFEFVEDMMKKYQV
jgi:hypothetical protein